MRREYKWRDYAKHHPEPRQKGVSKRVLEPRPELQELISYSQTAIAKQLGLSKERVRQLLHKHGLYEQWRVAQPQKEEKTRNLCVLCSEPVGRRRGKYCSQDHAILGAREREYWWHAARPEKQRAAVKKWTEKAKKNGAFNMEAQRAAVRRYRKKKALA